MRYRSLIVMMILGLLYSFPAPATGQPVARPRSWISCLRFDPNPYEIRRGSDILRYRAPDRVPQAKSRVMAPATVLTWDDIVPLPPPSGETFRATARWKKVEPLIWKVATAAGLQGDARQAWTGIIWNESRGQSSVRGDNGCAQGMGQIHAGGLGEEVTPNSRVRSKCLSFAPVDDYHLNVLRCWRVCNDARPLLPPGLRELAPSAFLDEETNLVASAYLYKQRGAVADPLGALTSYAGCETPNGVCGRKILGLHKWWRISGLEKRFQKLERPVLAVVDRR